MNGIDPKSNSNFQRENKEDTSSQRVYRSTFRGNVPSNVVSTLHAVNIAYSHSLQKATSSQNIAEDLSPPVPARPRKSGQTTVSKGSPMKRLLSSGCIPITFSPEKKLSLKSSFSFSSALEISSDDENLVPQVARRLVWDNSFKQLSQEAKKTKRNLLANQITIPNNNLLVRLLEYIPGIAQLMVILGIASPTQFITQVAQDLTEILYYELSRAVSDKNDTIAFRYEGVKILHTLIKNPYLKNVWELVKENSTVKPILPQFITKYKKLLQAGLVNPESKLSTQMLAEDLKKIQGIIPEEIKEEVKQAIHQALESPSQWPRFQGSLENLQEQFKSLAIDDPLRGRIGILYDLCVSTESYLKKLKMHLLFLKNNEFVSCFKGSEKKLHLFITYYKTHKKVMKAFCDNLLEAAQAPLSYDEKIFRIIQEQFNGQSVKDIVSSTKYLIKTTLSTEKLVESHYDSIKYWWKNCSDNLRYEKFFKPLDEHFELQRDRLDFGSLPFQRTLKFPLFLHQFADEYEQENKRIWEQISILIKENKERHIIWEEFLSSFENFENDQLWEEIVLLDSSDLVHHVLPLRDQWKKNAALWSQIWLTIDIWDKKIRSIQSKMQATEF